MKGKEGLYTASIFGQNKNGTKGIEGLSLLLAVLPRAFWSALATLMAAGGETGDSMSLILVTYSFFVEWGCVKAGSSCFPPANQGNVRERFYRLHHLPLRTRP